jgi:prepilin-type N-terminal cleavage/methylation domain-containing protein
MIENINKNQSGFTLIEILVSMAIFSILVFAAASIYIAFNNSQIRTTASQQLLNDSQYAMEVMAREIRNSTIVYPSAGSTWADWCYKVVKTWTIGTQEFDKCIILERSDGSVFALTSYVYTTVSTDVDLWYVALSNCTENYECDNWRDDYSAFSKLLSVGLNNINLESLDFYITPSLDDPFLSGGPNLQPKVTIKMETSYASGNKFQNVNNVFQTTVSSRVYKR